jgi:neopullulanase
VKRAHAFLLFLVVGWSAFAAPLAAISNPAPDQPELRRVEPPHWWVGMRSPELELLVHGRDLRGLVARVDDPRVRLVRTVQVENPNYLFLTLEIAADAAPGPLSLRFERDGREVLRHEYALQAREPGAAERRGFDRSDVLYLITPDRFVNGDPGNDTVEGMGDPPDRDDPYGRHGGDIAGIARSLDYLEDMGFTALWLNPVVENAMPTGSYHGYAATDFYRVDPRFGSNAEYRELVSEARRRGIDVIMDMIVNHCGSEHWFFKDPPTSDWINFGGDYVNTSHRRTTNQDPHASEADKRHFADGWFVETMPDLNQRNPLLATYLIQNTLWWIEEAGLAGIRMDTYPYPDKHFMTAWTCAVMREYPHFNIVGEEWSLEPAVVSYWQRGKSNRDGYVSCLPSVMDFPVQDALARALTHEEGFNDGWPELYETLALDFLYPVPEELVTFPDNHDMDRFFTQVGEDLDLFKLGLVFVLTTRGVPQLYYGTEVLMENSAAPGSHGVIRTDFPGGWAGDPVNAFTGEGLTPAQRETQAWLRGLLRWRRDQGIVHEGRLMHFAPEDGVYVYFRYDDRGTVMVALNKNPEPTELALARFAERLGGYTRGLEVLGGETHALGASLLLPARGALILELE